VNSRLTNRTVRNQAHLQADSGTVRYDLDMLVETAGRFVEAERRKDVVGVNMAVESFAIHCRAMIQFLFGHLEWIERPGTVQERFPPSRPTDVFARDYHAGWRHDCPAPSQKLGDSKWRADKHVSRRGLAPGRPATGRPVHRQAGPARRPSCQSDHDGQDRRPHHAPPPAFYPHGTTE
jgi:hypothetical protein